MEGALWPIQTLAFSEVFLDSPSLRRSAERSRHLAMCGCGHAGNSRRRRNPHSPSPIEMARRKTSQDAMPNRIAQQLATLVDAPPKGLGWVYEIKLAGYRILAPM